MGLSRSQQVNIQKELYGNIKGSELYQWSPTDIHILPKKKKKGFWNKFKSGLSSTYRFVMPVASVAIGFVPNVGWGIKLGQGIVTLLGNQLVKKVKDDDLINRYDRVKPVIKHANNKEDLKLFTHYLGKAVSFKLDEKDRI